MQFSFSINHTSLCYSNLKFFSSSEALSLISDHLSRSTQAMLFPSFILKSHITQLSHSATQLSKYFLSHSESPKLSFKPFFLLLLQANVPSWYFHFHLQFWNINFLSCSSSSQARVTSPKSLTFVAFPTHTVFNLNLIHSIFTSWNNDVQSLASWVRLTLVQQIPNIAWISFDLQEHKIHNNASPCYGTFIFALIKLPRIYEIPKPTYVGGKTWGRGIINAPKGHW